MARLKKTQSADRTPRPHEALPAHTRTPEWNGFKQGDEVIVRLPGKPARRGYRWYFQAHVTSPEGNEYLDVQEVRVGYAHGLWRSFPLDAVAPVHQPKRRTTA
jgi:hypothetical protein